MEATKLINIGERGTNLAFYKITQNFQKVKVIRI